MRTAMVLRQVITLLLLGTIAVLTVPQMAPAQSVLQQLVTPSDQQAEEAPPEALSPEQTQLIADLLRDDAAREALIAELERVATARAGDPSAAAVRTDSAEATAPATADAAAEEDTSFGRRVAKQSQTIAQDVAMYVKRLWQRLARIPALFSSLERVEISFLMEALTELVFVIVTTVGTFVILRLLARRLYLWMGRRSKPLGFAGRALVYIASLIVDVGNVLVALAAGYALAVTLFGEFGQISIRQTLYLNSFLAVEMVKVGIRAILSPAAGDLRPVHVGDEGARRTYRVLNIVVSIIGYGQLLVVPIFAQQFGYFPGRSVSVLLLLLALVILGWSVVHNRHDVTDWLVSGREKAASPPRHFWRTLAQLWWMPVLIYLAAVFMIVLVQPGDVLLPVLWGSMRILIAAAIGWMVAGLLGLAIARGVRLPAALNRRLPLLQKRLNAFVPRVLFVLRIVILLAVIAYSLNVAGLFDAPSWLDSAAGVRLTGTAFSVALILLVTFSIWLVLASWVDYRLNPNFGTVPTARESTLLTLLRNAVSIALVAITLMFVLSEIGVDIAPLIASAGIVGLAIGFGAQKMVQDIITGVFIQLENAINVGDVVEAGGVSGVVERLTIRSVSLRDLNGVYHIIPFSSVDTVSNFMREFAFAMLDMRIAYRVDVEAAKQALFDAFEELRDDPEHAPSILDDLEWSGVTEFTESAIILRVRIKTLPGKQWGTGRAYNAIVKRVFQERGIEIPFPHRRLYLGQGEQGEARVAVRSASENGTDTDETDAPTTQGEATDGAAPEAGAPSGQADPDAKPRE